MRRRNLIALIAGAAAGWPLVARAQQSAVRMRRVGVVMPYAKGDAEYESRARALRQELAKLGWTEGSNVQFDERWTTDDMNRVRAETASLMAANPMARFKSVWSQLILQERRYSARGCTRLMPE
jgi:putative tryptophan/tyrosine transport system substrate-binding protein